MQLHSTLNGRAGDFRVCGAAWQHDAQSFRGFLYLIPIRDCGDPRYLVVEAEGQSVWALLDRLSAEVGSIVGAPVRRLDAHDVVSAKTARRTARPKQRESG